MRAKGATNDQRIAFGAGVPFLQKTMQNSDEIDRILAKRQAFGAKQGLEDGLTKDERVQLARYEQISTLRRLYLKEKEAKEATDLLLLKSQKINKTLLNDNKALLDERDKVKELFLNFFKDKEE